MVTAQPLAINHLTKNDGDTLRTFVQSLQKEFGEHLQQVILFGSKARGDDKPDSDIDVLILADEENRQLKQSINKIAFQIELDRDTLFNVLLISSGRWQQMSLERFTLCRNIEKEGILLFSRAG